MATSVTYVGNSYSVPSYNDTGYAQGSGNLSLYLVALATGSLTLSGGSFPLTADVNFGTNFGLIVEYLKSAALNIATAGVIRLANSDVIAWRNAANSGNCTLGCNSNGDLVINTAGAGLVVTDTTNGHTYRIYVDNGVLATAQVS